MTRLRPFSSIRPRILDRHQRKFAARIVGHVPQQLADLRARHRPAGQHEVTEQRPHLARGRQRQHLAAARQLQRSQQPEVERFHGLSHARYHAPFVDLTAKTGWKRDAMNAVLSRNAPRIDHRAVLARQHWTYASGDYAVVGNALQIVERGTLRKREFVPGRAGARRGRGQFQRVAGRRAPLVRRDRDGSRRRISAQRSRQRIEAESWASGSWTGDAEGLPFGDQSFDAVMSPFGAMFAADQERAASEMIRVCRRGRQVGLANWTPDGFIGQLFSTIAEHAPQAPSAAISCAWGTSVAARGFVRRLRQSVGDAQKRRPAKPHAHGLGRQAAHGLSSRADGVFACSMPTASAPCGPHCSSWWQVQSRHRRDDGGRRGVPRGRDHAPLTPLAGASGPRFRP